MTTSNRRRWLVRAGVTGAIVLVLYAVLGFFLAPRIVRGQLEDFVAGKLGLKLTVAEIETNPFTLAATVRDLRIAETDGGPSLVAFDEFTANFEARSIFARAWTFADIGLVRPRLAVVRRTDGSINLERLIPPPGPAAPVEEERLEIPRLVIDRLRVVESGATLRDETRTPAFETTFGPGTIALDAFSTLPAENGTMRLEAAFAGGARVEIESLVQAMPARAAGRATISGFSLPLASEYLHDLLAFDITAGTSDVRVDYSIDETADGVTARITDGEVQVQGVALRSRQDGTEAVTLPKLSLTGLALEWPAHTLNARQLALDGLRVNAIRAADGTLDVMEMLTFAEAELAAIEKPTPEHARRIEKKSALHPWVVNVDRVALSDMALALEDRSITPPLQLGVERGEVTMKGVTLKEGALFATKFAGAVVSGGSIELAGRVGFLPPAAEARVKVADLSLLPAQPFVTDAGRLALVSGLVDVEGDVRYDGTANTTYRGSFALRDLVVNETIDNERFIGVQRLTAGEALVELETKRVRVPRVDAVGFFAQVQIFADRSTNIGQIFGKAASQNSAGARPAPKSFSKESLPFQLEIGDVRFSRSKVDFADLSLPLPFAAKIGNLEGRITELDSGGKTAKLEGKGTVDEYGSMRIEGRVDPFDPLREADLDIDFRNVEMSNLSPYSAAFAGYTIASGRLDLDLFYSLREARLDSQNKIVVDQMELGEKVDAPDAPNLPVRLAVSLLKDKDGKIDLDVPVTGTVNDPEFNYRRIVWKAIVKILGNVAAAPFVALGRLFGMDGKDLEYVEFEPGLAEVSPPTREKLEKLGKALAAKPELSLEVNRAAREEIDRPALKRLFAQRLVDERVGAAAAASGAAGELALPIEQRRAALEALVGEALGAPVVDEVRAAHTVIDTEAAAAAPPPPPPESESRRGRSRAKDEPAPAPPPPPTKLDLSAYLDTLFAKLVDAQPITEADVAAVADARAAAIAGFLAEGGGLDPARVRVVDKGRAKETDDSGVRVKLELKAG